MHVMSTDAFIVNACAACRDPVYTRRPARMRNARAGRIDKPRIRHEPWRFPSRFRKVQYRPITILFR
jgi:hypothetical protein